MEQSIRSLEVKKKLDDVKAQHMKAEQEKREKARELQAKKYKNENTLAQLSDKLVDLDGIDKGQAH